MSAEDVNHGSKEKVGDTGGEQESFQAVFRIWKNEDGELQSNFQFNRPPVVLEATVWHLMMSARCTEIESMFLEIERRPNVVTPKKPKLVISGEDR